MSLNIFVFDTNVLLSALLIETSIPAKALKIARTKGMLVVSEEVAEEYIAVFSKKKFEKYASLSNRFTFIENIISNALRTTVFNPIIACRDPKDDKFLSLAIAAHAGCIVSGDPDLLVMNPFQSIPILNPSAFLKQHE